MPLETGTYISDLDASNPLGSDDQSQGDNHLRLIKSLAKATFPNASKAFRFPTSGAAKTGNFSVTFPTDQNVLFVVDTTGGAITASLPDPTSGGTVNEDGFGFWILRSAGANAVTVSPSGVQTIMGAASYSLAANRQYAYFFWAGTINQWFVFEGNNPAITYALTIALASTTPLILNRTENNTSEHTILSLRLGSGAGAVGADTLVGGGANDVLERRRYIGATEIERLTTALALINIVFGVGSSLRMNPSGYVEFTEISTPANPSANVGRLFAFDDSSTTRMGALDSAGALLELLTRATQAVMVTATDVNKAVTAGRQHFHPGSAKAWGRAAGTGTIVSGDYNVDTISKTDTGEYLVTLVNALADTNYLVVPSIMQDQDRVSAVAIVDEAQFTIKIRNLSGAGADTAFGFVVYGTMP